MCSYKYKIISEKVLNLLYHQYTLIEYINPRNVTLNLYFMIHYRYVCKCACE